MSVRGSSMANAPQPMGHPGGHPGGHPHGEGGRGGAPRRSYRPGVGEAARAYEAKTGIKAPRIVAWEITRSCNLACAHCRASAHCEPYEGELTLEECRKVIDDIAAITDPILILTGGEPLMRPDIFEIIDYANERGLHPVVGTNGTLVTDEMAARIAASGIPRVSVSLDFPTAEGQDAFRGKEGAFDEAIQGMRNLRAHGVGVQVNSTITKMNNHLVDDLHELALSESAEAFHPFLLVPTGRGEDLVDVELTPDEYEEVLTWAYHCQKKSPMHFKPTDAPQYYRIIRQQAALEGVEVTPATHGMEAMTRGCLGGITFAFISHVGDVQPCGYFDMQLGNLRERSFEDIWTNSPVFADLRDYNRLKGKCGACEYKGVCGGCRARALAETGDYLAPEPYCAYVPRAWRCKLVLDAVQSGFPLESDPYGVLAGRLGLTRTEVLQTLAELREQGAIRCMGASISARHLGYRSSLCALAVEGDDAAVARAASLVNAHPEVTHNYLRNDRYNMWFTVITPDDAARARLLAAICAETGIEDLIDLPACKIYKIHVDFSEQERGATACPPRSAQERGPAREDPFDPQDPFDIALVRWLQRDMVDQEPFVDAAACIARDTGDPSVDEQRVLERLRGLRRNGTIRRVGAMVRHRKIGYTFNAVVVWDAPDATVDALGDAFAGLPFVSHCYRRARCDSWPFSLYAVVHAKSRGQLDAQVSQMASLSGLAPKVLVSQEEFKKSTPVYYPDEETGRL